MAAWIEKLSPEQRRELQDLCTRVSLMFGGYLREEPEIINGLSERLAERKSASVAVAYTEEHEPPAHKRPHKCAPGKMTSRIRDRMYELFDQGYIVRRVYELLQSEFGELRFKVSTVSYWKWQWNRERADQRGSEPTQPDESRPQEGEERESAPSEPAAGGAGKAEQVPSDPVPRPISESMLTPVKCQAFDGETVSLRTCESMRNDRPTPYCKTCRAWKNVAA